MSAYSPFLCYIGAGQQETSLYTANHNKLSFRHIITNSLLNPAADLLFDCNLFFSTSIISIGSGLYMFDKTGVTVIRKSAETDQSDIKLSVKCKGIQV